MICPHMSGPVVIPDPTDPSVHIADIYLALCERDRCPHYYTDVFVKGHCSFGEVRNER
jgi:hypothetical protein